MINREDMLELTRRMTLSRTSFTRVAGCYVDDEGYIDGTFNTNFLKLSAPERNKQLEIAKAIPFSTTNVNLKSYLFSDKNSGPDSLRQLLLAIRESRLKNDALIDLFYEILTEQLPTGKEYAILLYHDCYDVPVKAKDKERMWESEEVYEYLICAICPLAGEYEPAEPECGFLFPAFTDRSCDLDHIAIYQKDEQKPIKRLEKMFSF